MYSPSKDPDLLKTPCIQKDETNRNVPTQPDDSGFLSRVTNLKVDATDSKTIPQEEKLPYRPLISRVQLFKPGDQVSDLVLPHPKEDDLMKVPKPSARKPLMDTRPPISLYRSVLDSSKENLPKSSSDFQFCTPLSRQTSAVKENCISSTSERETKKPKVLFTTPASSTLKANSTPVGTIQRKMSPLKENPSTLNSSKPAVEENILAINNVEYVIDKKIGSGGSSLVYMARGRKSGKECAIKVVNLDGDSQMIEGYLNETKLLVRLQRNINVVELFDYSHQPEKKTLYMIMEKGDSDLHRILQSYRTHIPLYNLMKYWHQMLQAVNYIHQNGVIHSDLKPANFLMVNGRLKLIDFGIASNIALDSTSIIKFSQAGTFNYISPEALIDTSTGDSPARDQPRIRLSTRSDVWSLGCILYLLLYKKTPFSHIKQLPQKITAITSPKTVIDYPELPNFYPPLLLEMLKKCLVYHPKQRLTVAELLEYPFDMVIPIDNH